MNKRIEKIKTHFQENKAVYVAAIAGVIVGGAGVYILKTNLAIAVDSSQQIKGFAWKPEMTYTNNSTVINTLVRRGHPGNVIRCIETGETFASQNRTASANGIDAGSLSKHLRGLLPNVNGLTFEELGEATA